MEQYDHLNEHIRAIEDELDQLCEPDSELIEELANIPGVDKTLAQGIVGEATNDMTHFKDERKFAAWAGVAAGNNESGGKKRARVRRGNPHLRRLLVQAAHGAIKKKSSFYRNKYYKLRFRLGSAGKAKMAIANRVARSVFKVLAGEVYREIGYMRAESDIKKINTLVAKLRLLGADVKVESHQYVVKKTTVVSEDGVTA